MAVTAQFLKGIMTEARPIIERQMNDAKIIAGLRDVVSATGGDWGALKALIKAQVEDENDEAGDGKRVKKILEKAGCQTAYADMLGLANMNENNFSDAPPAFEREGVTVMELGREPVQSYAEAKGKVTGEETARDTLARFPNTMNALQASEASELTQTQEQPESEPCDYCADHAPAGEYWTCPKCDAEWFPEEDITPSPETPQAITDDEAAQANPTSSAPLSNPLPSSLGDAVKAPEAGSSLPASGARFNNPRCQHPDTCSHAHDQGSCDDCFFDWAKRPLDEQRRLWAEAMEAA